MNRSMKITSLTLLMMGSVLQAMDRDYAYSATPARQTTPGAADAVYLPTHQDKLSKPLQDKFDKLLQDAAEEGKIEEVNKWLNAGANVNSKGNFNWTALMLANQAGHKKVSELLIKKGANIADELNSDLFNNAKWGDPKKIKLLLEKGAEVNAQDNSGRTALIIAAWNGHEEVCKLLIAQGAAINARDDDGRTALIVAAWLGYEKICELLIHQEADVYARDNTNFTALMTALAHRHKGICKLLIDAMIKPTKEELAPILAMLGIQKKNQNLNLVGRNIVQLIGKDAYNQIVHDHKPKVRDQIMLVRADEKLQKQLINYLNMPSTNRLSEQLLAATKGNVENSKKVAQLIAKGALVNTQDKINMTPLVWAAIRGHKEVCELLIAHGAEVNPQAKVSMTPLIGAAIAGHKEICQLLIANNAEISAQTEMGQTALMYAAKKRHKEICVLLIDAMVKPTEFQIEHGEMKQQNKSYAKAEIMKIENSELRDDLLDYLNRM
jgi:ankyrin repeat protein